MKKLCLIAAVVFAVSSVHAQFMEIPFPNPGFEEPGVNAFPNGFEADPNVPGWFDLNPSVSDAGVEGGSAVVEGDGAWWGTYQNGFSAFMSPGDGAYNLSGHTIQAGEEYTVGFVAKSWNGSSEWTVSLFYDEPENVIATFVTAVDGTWTEYSSPSFIAATSESVGGTLGISFLNTHVVPPDPGFGDLGFGNLDDISVSIVPEPSTYALIFGAFILAGVLIRRRMRS